MIRSPTLRIGLCIAMVLGATVYLGPRSLSAAEADQVVGACPCTKLTQPDCPQKSGSPITCRDENDQCNEVTSGRDCLGGQPENNCKLYQGCGARADESCP